MWLRGQPLTNYNHAFMNYAMVRIFPGVKCYMRWYAFCLAK